MNQCRMQSVGSFFLSLALTACLLAACSDREPVPETQTVSGRVLDVLSLAGGETDPVAVAGATVQLIANNVDIADPGYVRPCRCECAPGLCSFITTSDAAGWWTLEDVPFTYEPETLLKNQLLLMVTKDGNVPSFILFPLAMSDQFDLITMPRWLALLLALIAWPPGATLDNVSLMFGLATGFADTNYPQQMDGLAGVTVRAEGGSPSQPIPVWYVPDLEAGEPPRFDPGETSPSGAFFFFVPDARENAMPSVYVSGTAANRVLVDGYYPACPGGLSFAVVIDPYYRP